MRGLKLRTVRTQARGCPCENLPTPADYDMQQSYGEQSVQIEDFRSGTVRVLGIHAEAAIYPRLGIQLGWTLREIPPTAGPSQFQTAGLKDYQLVSVAGELRVGEGGVVGLLWPAHGNIEIRSSPYHNEDHLTLACDLDLARLERIEEQRKGQQAKFSAVLWSTVIRSGQRVRSRMEPLEFQIPRDNWVEFLAGVRFGEYDVLELRRPTGDLDGFAEVREQLELARVRIQRGDYNAAVGAARTALERVIQDARGGGPPLKELLAAATDESRGENYAAIITKLKELCNRAVHTPDATVSYSRSESLFIVRGVESVVVLLGLLLPK
jgi:hypothetical protein